MSDLTELLKRSLDQARTERLVKLHALGPDEFRSALAEEMRLRPDVLARFILEATDQGSRARFSARSVAAEMPGHPSPSLRHATLLRLAPLQESARTRTSA